MKEAQTMFLFFITVLLLLIAVKLKQIENIMQTTRTIESEQRDNQNVLNCWILNNGDEVRFYQCIEGEQFINQ